ncbi:MAG: NADH-quinone oxidoreductase subunit NuoE [Pseudomonadota bacterium]
MALRRFDIEAGGDSFAFSAGAEENIAFWRGKYPEDRQQSAVIPLLWLAQKDNGGWLSEPAMREVAERLEMPYIRVYEVATFYTMFRLQPVGKHHIQLCGTTPCMLRGANDLKDVCVSKIGKKFAVTDDGKLSWEEVECLGACVNAPMVQINDDYFEDLTPESLAEVIDRLQNGAEVEPGPQTDRVNSEALGGTEVLTDPSLFDGSRAVQTAGLPNVPAPAPEPEPVAAAMPPAAPPTNVPRSAPKPEEVKAAEKVDGADYAGPTGERPQALSVDEADRDDLKKIKGIGPVNEAQLNELGIYTFAQIAAWTPDNVDWVEGYLSFPGCIGREDWIDQAKSLAAEKE